MCGLDKWTTMPKRHAYISLQPEQSLAPERHSKTVKKTPHF